MVSHASYLEQRQILVLFQQLILYQEPEITIKVAILKLNLLQTVPDLDKERHYTSPLVRPLPIPHYHDFKENY